PLQDAHGPVELLGHHDAGELVRQGDPPEAPARGDALAHRRADARGAADDERMVTPGVTPVVDLPRQFLAAPGGTAHIEERGRRPVGDPGHEASVLLLEARAPGPS